jgi:hypothetical protein
MTTYSKPVIHGKDAADIKRLGIGEGHRRRTGHRGAPRKVDANQPAIVAELRQAGCSVTDTHTLGAGFPDLVVGRMGATWLFEVKVPGGTLTDDERTWFDEWRGQAAIIYSAEDALRIMGVMA